MNALASVMDEYKCSPPTISPPQNFSPRETLEDGSPSEPKNSPRGLRKNAQLILSLQLRGFRQREIAELVGLSQARVSIICNSERYLAAFDGKLGTVDDEFLRLKPKAYRALQSGLDSRDEATGLRAAQLWFQSMGYKGFSRVPEGDAGSRATAEDIALALFRAGGGSVTISAQPKAEQEQTQGQVISP